MSMGLPLRELVGATALPAAVADLVVRGLSLDSRSVREGDAFFALRGTRAHGITFAPAASARGAAAILADTAGAATPRPMHATTPTLWIDGLREKLGALAARFFGEPSRSLTVIGVTGTNGKTSTVQLLAQALNRLGRRAATIGTLGAGLPDTFRAGERTTPDAIALQGLFAEFRDAGASDVAMEVSSHALEQGRVDGTRFVLAIFTNLTRDHLDYHGTMHAYGAAKQRLFGFQGLRHAIVNRDDAFGRELLATLPEGVQALAYGIDDAEADASASAIEAHIGGLRFNLRLPSGEGMVSTRLLGRFNVSNLLAVAAALHALGVGFADIAATLAVLEPVAGRMNRLGGESGQPLVVIDYAHTPDALEQALASLRAHCDGRLVCVFGCGGERDVGKRPQMAAIAERLADVVIVTDDNPRGEDGDAIVADILTGFSETAVVRVERDRARAITLAVREAQAGDLILVAGKGHEPYQEITGARIAFDDRVVARAALEARSC